MAQSPHASTVSTGPKGTGIGNKAGPEVPLAEVLAYISFEK
jgi:hypothetical protein